MPTFSGGYGPISAQKVAAVERRLQMTFPPDYKRFLRTTNGGMPDPSWFLVPNRGGAFAHVMFGIREDRSSNDLEYQHAELLSPLPPGWLWIGRDKGSNLLVLTTLEADAGRVLFVDRHGFYVREDGVNAFQVAASFTEFVEGLGEMPTPAEPSAAPDRSGTKRKRGSRSPRRRGR
jgi:hypothetical protein